MSHITDLPETTLVIAMCTLTQSDWTIETLLQRQGVPSPCMLTWLGQAGFLIRFGALRVVIDAYLTDSLATKYQGAKFPHTRLMQPPVELRKLLPVDLVLCSHGHTDHMDAGTLAVLLEVNPNARVVVPGAETETAKRRGVPANRIVAMNDGDSVPAAPGLVVHAIASAHEQLRVDECGNHHCLGYVMESEGAAVYHSGDCVPYGGLVERLREFDIDLALLPVNGRDDARRHNGILGNFTFAEAVACCVEAGIPSLVPCHFGMFDFNTVDPCVLDCQIVRLAGSLHCVRLEPGHVYQCE